MNAPIMYLIYEHVKDEHFYTLIQCASGNLIENGGLPFENITFVAEKNIVSFQ